MEFPLYPLSRLLIPNIYNPNKDRATECHWIILLWTYFGSSPKTTPQNINYFVWGFLFTQRKRHLVNIHIALFTFELLDCALHPLLLHVKYKKYIPVSMETIIRCLFKVLKKNLLTFNTYLLFSYHFRNYKHELSWLEIFWLEMSWMNVLLRVHRFHRLRNLLCTSNFSPKNGSQTDYFTYYSQLHNSSGSEVY